MRFILLIILSILVISCSSKAPELKSPCVAIESEDGTITPCIRRPANAHWLA